MRTPTFYPTFEEWLFAVLRDPDLIERLAEVEHERWASWEAYRSERNAAYHPGGENYERRWKRQRATLYEALSEEEKESDRQEARRTLGALTTFLRNALVDRS